MSRKTQTDDGIKTVEDELGIKLRKVSEQPEAASITFVAEGKRYDKFKENLKDELWKFFIVRRGILGVLAYVGIFLLLVLIGVDFPTIDIVIFFSPLIIIFDWILAGVVIKSLKIPILTLAIERSAVPASLTLDGDGKRVDTVMLKSEITGWDINYVYEKAITDTPKPGSLHIPDYRTIPNIRNNKKMCIVEKRSDDGTFAMANPFDGYNSVFLLNAYQKPKVLMSKEYEKNMKKLTSFKGMQIQEIKPIKERDREIRKKIGEISILAKEQRDDLKRHKLKIRKVMDLDINFDRFLTNLDKANIDWWKEYEEQRDSPEHITRNDLIDLKNNATSILYIGKSLNDVLPKIHHKVRIEEHIDKQQIEDIDISAILNAAKIDMEKTGSPKTSLILERAKESYQPVDEEDE